MTDRQEIGDLIYSVAAEYIERRVGFATKKPHSLLRPYYSHDLTNKFDILR
jgi:hypothetical protein